MTKHIPPQPRDILYREFIEPRGLSIRALAKDLDIPVIVLHDLLLGLRAVDDDLATRLARELGTSVNYWLTAQLEHDKWLIESRERYYD